MNNKASNYYIIVKVNEMSFEKKNEI